MFDVFVSPTRPPGEGFGRALADACAAGVPAVASNFGGATAIVDDGVTGYLLPLNLKAWTFVLDKLHQDSALRQRMGQAAARRMSERFSPDAVARRLEAIMYQVAGECRSYRQES